MTLEEALEECFNILTKDYGKIKHKLITSRQTAKEALKKLEIAEPSRFKNQYKDTLETLLDMFDIAEIQLDHIHDAKILYSAHKRQSTKEYPIKLVKESVEHYLAFYKGQMVPLRSDDTISHLYESILSKELRRPEK